VTSKFVDVVVVGSANLDLVATVERLPRPGETVIGTSYAEHPGGKGLNQAVAARRAGATTALVTSLGSDAAGDLLHRVMTDEDLVPLVHESTHPTGRALIEVDESAENSIVVIPGANGDLGLSEIDRHRDLLSTARVVLCQLEVPMVAVETALAIAKAGGAVTVLNPAPAAELTRSMLELCDVVMPNQHEIGLLGGVDELLATGVRAVVLTLGARGLRVVTADDRLDVPPFAVRAVDTTGAGDAACGALAAALARGLDLPAAAREAAAAGALAATRQGAVPSLPTRVEIEALLGT